MNKFLIVCSLLLCVAASLGASSRVEHRLHSNEPYSDVLSVLTNPPPSALAPPTGISTATSYEGSNGDPNAALADQVNPEVEDIDAQIEELQSQQEALKQTLEAEKECARKIADNEKALKRMEMKEDELKRRKLQKLLEIRLDKQRRDLQELKNMHNRLSMKMNELTKTKRLINSRIIGTETELKELANETVDDADDPDAPAEDVALEMKKYHDAQEKVLKQSNVNQRKMAKRALDEFKVLGAQLDKEKIPVSPL